jgi:hypothetical protein
VELKLSWVSNRSCICGCVDCVTVFVMISRTYLVNLLCNDVLMTIEVEDEESGERWSAEFTAQCE